MTALTVLRGVCRDLGRWTCQPLNSGNEYADLVRMGMSYQLYTSEEGGKTFFPDWISLWRNLFRLRNSLETISSFNTLSQLSCRVSISSFSSCLCSSLKASIHFCLSKMDGAGSVGGLDGFVLDVLVFVLGGPKKLVMEPFAFGFFASAVAISAALRLRDILYW